MYRPGFASGDFWDGDTSEFSDVGHRDVGVFGGAAVYLFGLNAEDQSSRGGDDVGVILRVLWCDFGGRLE